MQSAHEAAGATGTRRSPRPLRGGGFINGSGALRGEGVNVCLMDTSTQRAQSSSPAKEPVKDTDLILRSLRSKRLEGWTQRRDSRPSFETRARGALLRMRSEIYSEPRKRAIQYSEASVMESKGRGVLDTRLRGYDDSSVAVLVGNRGAGLLTRLGVLDVEFAHRAGNDEIIVVEHQRPRDAVLVKLERHRVYRRLLAVLGFGVSFAIPADHRPPRQRFHRVVRCRRVRRRDGPTAGYRLPDHGKRIVDLLAVVGSVIDHQFEHGLPLPRRRNDVLDLLGRKYRAAIERKRLGHRLFQFDRDMIAGPLRYPVDRARVGVIHPRIDLEAIALARAILPGSRAQVAQRHLALAAVQLRDLPEFRGVAFAGAAGEIIEDSSARAVARVGTARLYQAELIKRLMREKRAARRGNRWPARETRSY